MISVSVPSPQSIVYEVISELLTELLKSSKLKMSELPSEQFTKLPLPLKKEISGIF